MVNPLFGQLVLVSNLTLLFWPQVYILSYRNKKTGFPTPKNPKHLVDAGGNYDNGFEIGKKNKNKKMNNCNNSIPLNLLNLSSFKISRLNCYSIRLKAFGGHREHDFTPRIPVRVLSSWTSPLQGRFTIKGENSVLMPILRSSDQLGVH